MSSGIRTGPGARGAAAFLVAAGLLITAVPAQAATAPAAPAAPRAGAPSADVVPGTRTATPALVDGIREAVDAGLPAADAARRHLAAKESRYKIDNPGRDLAPLRTQRHGADETVRLQQRHRGVPVLGGQYVVRMDNGGGERVVTGTSGKYFTGLRTGTTPSVDKDVAVRRAVTATLERLGGHRLTEPAPDRGLRGTAGGLVVIPRGEGVLAYQVTVRGADPVTGGPVLQQVYIDARAGFPVLQFSGIRTFTAPPATAAGGTAATATVPGPGAAGGGSAAAPEPVTGSGTLLSGGKVELNVSRRADAYVMADAARGVSTWDARGRDVMEAAGGWPEGIEEFASPTAGFGKEATDAGAVDAHWAAARVYDYYKRQHARDGLDGRGSAVNSLVGVTDFGSPFVNAFWDGTKMVYGSGDDEYKPLSGDLDVVGHEMTHGVVEHTANLVYAGQSGALNEAIADYFGNAIDVTVSGMAMDHPDAGLVGEDLCRTAEPRRCALRDLDDGATTSENFLGVTFGTDNGGVHLNSTIFAGALWDLRQDLGGELADRIVYKALSEYLTPLDGFTQGRDAVLAAAADLGVAGGQLTAVRRSFNAHGIVAGWEEALGVDSDELFGKLNINGTGVQAGGGWWATSKSNDDGTEPYSVYAGRADGTGTPRLISPNDGRYHVYPATDGRTVVWAAYGGSGVDILSRPLAGGPVKRLYTTGTGDVFNLRVDGGVTVFEVWDPFGARHVAVLRPGEKAPTFVDGGRDDVMTALPSVSRGRIAYAKVYPDGDGHRLGVDIRDVATGRTVPAGQLGEPQSLGRTAVNGSHVFWLVDEIVQDDGRMAVRRADLDGTNAYDLSGEAKPGALVPDDLTVSGTAVTVSAVLPEMELRNETLSKVWQLTPDGSRKERFSCNRGEQISPAAVSGTQVVWLDGTTGWTNLVTRGRPAGRCG
ncbi:M4 family metallopeptidase [Streptomyces sp. NPDC050856]|uniref:M4 family metallopeptidase n=1 Tax=Streptomyces sp. NPDC050856 TaxID=3154939 RepID=UPI0033F62BA9